MKTIFALLRKWFGGLWKAVSIRARLVVRWFTRIPFVKGTGAFLKFWFVILTLGLTFAPSLIIGMLAFNEGFMDYVLYLTAASAVLTVVPAFYLSVNKGGGNGSEHAAVYLAMGFVAGALTSIVFFVCGLVQRVANEFGAVILPTLTPITAAVWITRIAFGFAAAMLVFSLVASKEEDENLDPEMLREPY